MKEAMDDTTQTTPDAPPPFGYTVDGSPRVSGYFAVIGTPPTCGASDFEPAFDYLNKINRAIFQGGWKPWEMGRLKKLKAKWERRAFGNDPRFNLVGTQDGRLPAATEHELRPARARARDLERIAKGASPVDQRSNPERRWPRNGVIKVDLDLPLGKAKGFSVDPDADVFEPETGEMPLPVIPPARQYLIPGQDTKGHAHRVYCRVMPAHYRAMCALERSKHFGFRTTGDLVRWCIDFGVRELTERAKVPQVVSALAQVDIIREILVDEQYYLEFPSLFEQLTTTINRHLSAGAATEAVRLIALVLHEIERMSEPYWKEKYRAELMKQYGHHLDGSQIASAEFGGQE